MGKFPIWNWWKIPLRHAVDEIDQQPHTVVCVIYGIGEGYVQLIAVPM
jgi:hypothetical protein